MIMRPSRAQDDDWGFITMGSIVGEVEAFRMPFLPLHRVLPAILEG
jgi:hypothetical protein